MLASCLVLCATEIALGDTENWHRHLQGARQVILAAKGRGKGGQELRGAECYLRSTDGRWLLRNFAYHDVLGSVTSTEGPLLRGAYWVDKDSTDTVVDAYVGIGSGVLAILSEISYLATERVFPTHEGNILNEDEEGNIEMKVEFEPGDPEFWETADELEAKLQQYVFPDCPDSALVELAEAYRHSAFIVLYRKQRLFLDTYPQKSVGRSMPLIVSKLSESINSTIARIEQIPSQSLPECGLLFPLFMVGGETREAKHIEMVRVRIQTLLKDRGFGNLAKAQEVLEELWRLRVSGARGPEGRDLDWMDILARKGWRLMLS